MVLSVSDKTYQMKWRILYRTAWILSIVMIIIIPIQIIIFSISYPPESIEGWFELFHNNWFLGLIHSDLLYIIDNIIVAIIYLAAGQMLIFSWKGTAFDIYYVLNGITLLIISVVMFKSNIYGKRTAYVGLVSGLLMSIPSTVGTVGLIFSLLSLIPWIAFTIMVANKLKQLSEI